MNELTLADLDMGTCLPQVLSTSTPKLDRRGAVLCTHTHTHIALDESSFIHALVIGGHLGGVAESIAVPE